MSQPRSPSSEQLSLLDVQDDSPQQRSAISDTARHERLAALERRLNRSTPNPVDTSQPRSPDDTEDPQPFDANHAKRIEFRRLVDPGILRPNSKEVALRSMRVSLVTHSHSRADYCKVDNVFHFFIHIAPLVTSCRHYLQSRRICYMSLTTPSSVNSSRRIRSSSGILWIPRARSSTRSRSVAYLFASSRVMSNYFFGFCLTQMGFRPEV